jgi:DNA mismatch repair protein MutS
VARLAGVPDTVTRRADEILKEIEREAIIEPLSKKAKTKRSSRYTQLIFFDAPESSEKILQPQTLDPVLEEILGLDLDHMTPLEALNSLAKYQRKLRERDGKN